MKIKLFQLLTALVLVVNIFIPQIAMAQAGGGCDKLQTSFNTYAGNYANAVTTLPQYCSATELLQQILNIAFGLVGAITIIFIMIGGYRYITSAGNAEQAASGKNTALYSVIGLIIVIMAATLVNIIINLVVYNKVV